MLDAHMPPGNIIVYIAVVIVRVVVFVTVLIFFPLCMQDVLKLKSLSRAC